MTRAATVLLAAVLLGGCAKPGPPAGAPGGPRVAGASGGVAGSTGSGGTPAPGATGSGSTGSGGAAVNPTAKAGAGGAIGAKADAARLLAEFTPPAGATRLSGVPAALAKFDWAISTPGVDQLAQALAWWRVPGDATAVTAAIQARPPAGSVVQGTASSRGSGLSTPSQGVTFAWPDDGVLRYRQLQVATAQLGPDTVIRAEALVAYTSPKPVSAEIGPDAKVAVVSLMPRANAGVTNNMAVDPPEPVTVTDPAEVAKIAAVINAAQPDVPGVRHCPMMRPGPSGMTIVFETTVAGPKLATAYINTNGCQGITVTPAGGGKPVSLAGGADQIDQIIGILGVRWPRQG